MSCDNQGEDVTTRVIGGASTFAIQPASLKNLAAWMQPFERGPKLNQRLMAIIRAK